VTKFGLKEPSVDVQYIGVRHWSCRCQRT